jgi:hypothetical protein
MQCILNSLDVQPARRVAAHMPHTKTTMGFEAGVTPEVEKEDA